MILYSNNCPRCNILKSKLISKNIDFDIVDDLCYMISIGLDEMTILEVNRKRMSFTEANKWINEQWGNKQWI